MLIVLKIDFYKTENAHGHGLDISEFLTQCHALPFGSRRVDVGDGFIHLHNLRSQGGQLIGEVVRGHMTDLPDKVDRNTGLPSDLGLRAHEGIGRPTHFLYDAPHHVLVLQRSREARPASFREAVATPIEEEFALTPILKPDALQRLNRMRSPRKVSIKFARPDNPAVFRGIDASAGHMIDLLNDFEGVYIDVSVSVGKSRVRFLDRSRVFRAARSLFQEAGEGEVKKIVISGKETPESATEIIDFFEDRLVYEEQVEPRRKLDSETCEAAVRRAYRENADYLHHYGQ
jgi:uncharacterized protein DUF6731